MSCHPEPPLGTRHLFLNVWQCRLLITQDHIPSWGLLSDGRVCLAWWRRLPCLGSCPFCRNSPHPVIDHCWAVQSLRLLSQSEHLWRTSKFYSFWMNSKVAVKTTSQFFFSVQSCFLCSPIIVPENTPLIKPPPYTPQHLRVCFLGSQERQEASPFSHITLWCILTEGMGTKFQRQSSPEGWC